MATSNSRIPADRDIALLRPETLPRGQRFETLADARRTRAAQVDRLERIGGACLSICDTLDDCGRPGADRCGSPNCAVCARAFRRRFLSEVFRLVCPGDIVVTYLIEEIPGGRLSEVDPRDLRRRLQRWLQRNLPPARAALGGFEVAFDVHRQMWRAHAHLVLFGVGKGKAPKPARSNIKRAVKEQVIKHPGRQLSYLLKFMTIHRPGKQTGQKKPRAFPLPPNALAELATWWDRYALQDFVVAVGLRRRGDTFVNTARGRARKEVS